MQIPRSVLLRATWIVALTAAVVAALPVRGADKRIVLIAGKPSHPPGEHEFRAGSLLMQKALSGVPGVKVDVYDMGWPARMVDGNRVEDSSLLDGADAVLIYADGRTREPGDPGRPHAGARCAGGKRCRARFRSLWRRGAPRRARRLDAPLDWRLLRGPLFGQPDVEAAVRQAAEPSHHSRRRSVRHLRRVVLQHALVYGPRGPEARDADSRGDAERRGAPRPLRQPEGPVRSHHRRLRPGRKA